MQTILLILLLAAVGSLAFYVGHVIGYMNGEAAAAHADKCEAHALNSVQVAKIIELAEKLAFFRSKNSCHRIAHNMPESVQELADAQVEFNTYMKGLLP